MEVNPGNDAVEARKQLGRLEKEENQSVQGTIAIKGTRSGLLLTLEPETPFSDLLHALADRLSEAPSFFRGACLTVDTSRRSLQRTERLLLEDLLAHYQVSIAEIRRHQHLQAVAVREGERRPFGRGEDQHRAVGPLAVAHGDHVGHV